ncbi:MULTISPECIES: PPK2 family polyphosphate kinase [Streptomyces]|uniref:PPK2 family polyphosphate kinase n=1 Tax=Streptomyces TaxID=1883 RepID=UPI001677C27A|nr:MULTISPECIES: PPK2 family polyphosphate kinase [Streptomyces]MBD3577941.1 polyphosphate kinase 2 family protein [Streptomyces sp. KD18]GGS99249.1 polyphosphate--nucleotide phosphotransferase [Streptomyces toxytricini]
MAGKSGGRDRGQGGGRPATAVRDVLRVPVGGPVDLAARPTDAIPAGPSDKAAGRAAVEALAGPLAAYQERLRAAATAGGRRRLLLVLQGMHASGKGGTVKHVIGLFDPAGCRVKAFKAPTPAERSRPFLWRIAKALPHPGEIGVFDRSHYEDVLIGRVRSLAPPDELERRCEELNRFEESLAADGTAVVKVFLHLGYEEQRRRMLKRLDDPAKHWKFDPGDMDERALWPAYREAYEAVLGRCSTAVAPWYVVPADRKWYRDWAVGALLLEHLEEMDPRCPPAGYDVGECRARLLRS